MRLFRLVIEEVQYDGWNESAERRSQWNLLVSDMLRVVSDIAIVSLKLHVPKQAHRLMQAAIRAERTDRSMPTPHTLDDIPLSGDVHTDTLPDSSHGADEDYVVDENEDEDEEEADIASVDCRGHAVLAGSELNAANAHLIVVSSWLSIKEVCLLLGAWVSTCPALFVRG